MTPPEADDTLRFGDLLRAAVRGLPDAAIVNRGLLQLALLRPDRLHSIGRLLEQRAAATPQAPALRDGARLWRYGEFNAWANRIAAVLREDGVRPGDRVALLMENRAEVLACVAAIVKLGAVAAMLNHQQRGEVLAHSLELTRMRGLIAGPECAGALAAIGRGPGDGTPVHWWWMDAAPPQGWADLGARSEAAAAGNPPETAAVRLRQPCFLIFTSGTTGLPKASVMTHYRWLRSMAGLGQAALRLRAEDVLYCCLPLYHNNALTVSWGSALGAGATLAIGRRFSASRFWDEIRDAGATAFCYIGELCRYLLNQPPAPGDRDHAVRVVVGNGLRPDIWDAFQQRFGIERICEFYGASEGNLAFANGFGLPRTAGYCPLPFAVVAYDAEAEAPLRGADGRMRKVARGEVGLLVTEVTERAPFDGYTDARASEARLLREVFKRGDCWFNTGDLVRDQGYRHIQFVDRVGDTFRWKGENVATTEVEAALLRCAGVREAVVYGVRVPGADGRAGMAALVLDGAADAAALKALAASLQAALPPYAVPLFLRIGAAPELTATFKVRKGSLKRQGCDPAEVADPLFVLLDRARGYEPLTPALFAQVGRGELRL